MNAMQKWSIGFLLSVGFVAGSYVWLDRPIALFVHDQFQHFDLFRVLTYIPDIITPLMVLAFAAAGLHAWSGRPLPKLQTVVVLAVASLAVAAVVKDQLKFAFGRTWPETWV